MESLFWHLTNRTAETRFIFNLFHLLLAGLTLLVLLHQLRAKREESGEVPNRLLALGFFFVALHFALLTLYFGAGFFFHKELQWAGFERLSHGLMACALLIVVSTYLEARRGVATYLAPWTLRASALVAGVVVVDLSLSLPKLASGEHTHSLGMLATDLMALLAVGLGTWAALRGEWEGRRASLIAMACLGIAFSLHSGSLLLSQRTGIFIWNAEQQILSVSLFAFAWAAGQHSRNLLDRVFVRLNLTFIILASLIMLITAGMEKYQYLRLAEERSMNLAEFLRGHIVYYRGRGESLEAIFRHSEVLRRVVVEFGTLPELRKVDIYLDGQRASFRYTADWEVKEEIVSLASSRPPDVGVELPNSFQMIRLPVEAGTRSGDRIEFLGTMDYIDAYIGKYIILIYLLFTAVVGLATGVIGMIVTDADRRIRRQYAELQETHQQLAQAAKLASIGELAGGVAHEINTPITSILSLATHLVEAKNPATLTPGQRQNLQVIGQQAERVSKIVGNLLTLARQSRLELTRVDVAELLDTALTLIQHRWKGGKIRLHREIETDLPLALGDAGRLTEVFVNLLNNAIDAMPDGGTLVVRASPNSEPDGGVRIEVADTGSGIPAEHLPRIFDPFFTTKQSGRGTGLGLSVSHGIVKDHGGYIRAESEPGRGTTLIVILPKEVS